MTDEHRPATGPVNYGIQIGPGGNLHAHAVAVGPHAGARSEVSGPSLADNPALVSELRKQVEQLLAELTAQVDRQGDAADTLAAVQEGAAELAKEQPEQSVVVAAFKRAAVGITSLGAVAGSLQSILHLLGVR